MNEDVTNMIATLHARLDDVSQAVAGLPVAATGYATRLDKVDDELYAIECELLALGKKAAGTEQVAAAGGEQAAGPGSNQAVADAAGTAGVAGQTSAASGAGAEVAGTAAVAASAAAATDTAATAGTTAAATGTAAAPTGAATSSSSEKGEIFTPEAKEHIADAGRAIGSVLRDSKDVVSELSGTMSEIKDVFTFKPKK